jgi:hypothetical protein
MRDATHAALMPTRIGKAKSAISRRYWGGGIGLEAQVKTLQGERPGHRQGSGSRQQATLGGRREADISTSRTKRDSKTLPTFQSVLLGIGVKGASQM